MQKLAGADATSTYCQCTDLESDVCQEPWVKTLTAIRDHVRMACGQFSAHCRPGGEQASRPGGEPKDWHPEQAEDPNQPQPEDPHKADVPDMQSSIKGQRAELAPESAADK